MIKILDSFVSDKIAAGEVIERPLSIIKELIENSIDAKATHIIIEIKNGGKSYIRVTDDGVGIAGDEMELAFERHATGKIATLDDLNHITTLGFRGEALTSIAAVSRVTIYSKRRDANNGSKLVLHGGQRFSFEEAGVNDGTTIVVEDVFYNTPARRKFMKSDAAEASVIIDLIQKLAIFYSHIAFRLINNGKIVVSTSGDGDFRNAITSIFPTSDYRNLIEINNSMLHGFISNPGVTRNSRRGQIFFVNGRIVQSQTIERGIQNGYGDRLFSGYPIAILFISVDPESIDVNVHPAKSEIKFLYPDEVVRSISEAIAASMHVDKAIPSAVKQQTISEHVPEQTDQLNIRSFLSAREHDNTDNYTVTQHSDVTNQTNKDDIIEDKKTLEVKKQCIEDERINIADPESKPFDFEDITIKGYIFSTYVITQSGDNLYVLDQHAAHERILYERLVNWYDAEEHPAQPILTPFTLDVAADLYNGERNYLSALTRMGFQIEDFGNNTFIIRGIPSYMSLAEAKVFSAGFIEGFRCEEINTTVIDKLIMRSCKSAIKANDNLSGEEISSLLNNLSKCKNPFSCPHGRPTFIKITKYDVERAFKRK